MRIDLLDPSFVHVMLDFEMLGPGDTAKVIGVGAAVFGVNPVDPESLGLDAGKPFSRLVYEAWPVSVARQDHRTHTWDTVHW